MLQLDMLVCVGKVTKEKCICKDMLPTNVAKVQCFRVIIVVTNVIEKIHFKLICEYIESDKNKLVIEYNVVFFFSIK